MLKPSQQKWGVDEPAELIEPMKPRVKGWLDGAG